MFYRNMKTISLSFVCLSTKNKTLKNILTSHTNNYPYAQHLDDQSASKNRRPSEFGLSITFYLLIPTAHSADWSLLAAVSYCPYYKLSSRPSFALSPSMTSSPFFKTIFSVILSGQQHFSPTHVPGQSEAAARQYIDGHSVQLD